MINRFVFALMAVALMMGPGASAEEGRGPVAAVASPDGATLYVAEYCARQISVVDAASGNLKAAIALPQPPAGIAISPDGKTLYAAGADALGQVFSIDLAAGSIARTISVGNSPAGIAVSPDGAQLYVCERFDNAVGVYDAAAGAQLASIAVGREPFAVALTADGARLVVANLLPEGASNGEYLSAQVSIVDTAARKVAASVLLPNGSGGLRGVCLSPDGQFAYVAHVLGRYQLPTTQLERGWMNTNAVSIIDMASTDLTNTVLLDDVDLGAANPWGVACTPDGKSLCVAHAGTHEISVIDRAALHDRLAKVAAGERVSDVSARPEDVPNDLAFLVGLRRRVKLHGNGPRGLAIAAGKVYACEFFSDSIGCVDLASAKSDPVTTFKLAPDAPMSVTRRGEMLFNDARMCFQQWQSCASCHPDARADGLNWDLLNDGIGNPKNTKSMLLSHSTPPVMASGVRESAEKAVRSGMKFIQFTMRPEEDAVAVDEYLKSMKPHPATAQVRGDAEATKRGEAVFNAARCAECHSGALYTDMKQYDFGTGLYSDTGVKFDTPSLVEVWRTAPYLHDGRAATVKELFTKYNPGDKHGITSNLTEQELDDLVQYVLSR